MTRRGGFTVTELLVAIGVIAVLLGITIAAVTPALSASAEVKSLSNVKQLVTVIEVYALGEDSTYPAFEEGVLYRTTGGPGDPRFEYPYWQIATHWSGVVYEMLPYRENVEVYISPGSGRLQEIGPPFPSSYVYSTSFAGQPNLWSGTATADPSLQRPAKTHQVAAPSSKVLLWDGEAAFDDTPADLRRDAARNLLIETPAGFADGSARPVIPAAASEATPNPFPHIHSEAKLHNTSEGVRGRDF